MVNGEVVNGTVAAVGDDGHYSLTCDCDKTITAVKRSELCLEWQMDADSAACEVTVAHRHQQLGDERMAEVIRNLAAVRPTPAQTSKLFQRSDEGRRMRRRAATGALTDDAKATIPECFRTLLQHLAAKRRRTLQTRAITRLWCVTGRPFHSILPLCVVNLAA